MSLLFVANGSMFFVELYSGRVPIEHHEIEPFAVQAMGKLCGLSQHSFAKSAAAVIGSYENVLEKHSFLPAKAGEDRVKERVSSEFASVRGDEAMNKRARAKNGSRELFFGDLDAISEVFKFSEFAQKLNNAGEVVWNGFSDLYLHSQSIVARNGTKRQREIKEIKNRAR